MQHQGKVVLFIANSLDGFIAKPDGDISFLAKMEKAGEDYGYAAFMQTVGAVILGRKTHDKVVSMGYEAPYGDKPTYVISRSTKSDNGAVQYYNGDLSALINELKSTGNNIFLDGGATLVNNMLALHLIDKIIISIIPIILGSGIRLFNDNNAEYMLNLISTNSFESGLVQMHYTVLR